MPLQKAIVDFGADVSFEEVTKKIERHYKVSMHKSTARAITLDHANNMLSNTQVLEKSYSEKPNTTDKVLITQIDGGMIPIVDIDDDAMGDRRKAKKINWKEVRASCAYKHGNITRSYAATLEPIDRVKEQLRFLANLEGIPKKHPIHALGDGARWIQEMVESLFGSDANFTIDYYHLMQYVGGAATCCSSSDTEQWFKNIRTKLKESELDYVLNELREHMEEGCGKGECLAAKCYQYMIKRTNQFDYKGALDKDLPIGSGTIESVIKWLVQRRLKISGASRKKDNAEKMLNLRAVRANNMEDAYWHQRSPGEQIYIN